MMKKSSQYITDKFLRTIHVSNGNIYLYSDGYQDKFGGTQRKKFMSRKFRETLLHIHLQSTEQQHNHLNTTLNNWIQVGNETQTDDITVMGLQI